MSTPTKTHPNAGTALSTGFDGLLGEIDQLLKSSTAKDPAEDGDGDEIIRRAAGEADGDGTGSDADPDGDADGEEPFGKSFDVTLPDGSTQAAYDGTAMLKALHAENGVLRGEIGGAQKALTAAVGLIRSLTGTIAEQGSMLKSLTADVKALGNQGTGRRAMLSTHDKPTGGGAAAASTATHGSVMAKAMALFQEGKMDGGDLRRIESHQGRGALAPPDVLARFPGLTG